MKKRDKPIARLRRGAKQDRAFNDALGVMLNTSGDPPDTRGKSARILLGAAIALVAAGLLLATKFWIGT